MKRIGKLLVVALLVALASGASGALQAAAATNAPATSLEGPGLVAPEAALGGGFGEWFKRNRNTIVDSGACMAAGVALGLAFAGVVGPVGAAAAAAAALRCF